MLVDGAVLYYIRPRSEPALEQGHVNCRCYVTIPEVLTQEAILEEGGKYKKKLFAQELIILLLYYQMQVSLYQIFMSCFTKI